MFAERAAPGYNPLTSYGQKVSSLHRNPSGAMTTEVPIQVKVPTSNGWIQVAKLWILTVMWLLQWLKHETNQAVQEVVHRHYLNTSMIFKIKLILSKLDLIYFVYDNKIEQAKSLNQWLTFSNSGPNFASQKFPRPTSYFVNMEAIRCLLRATF